MKYFQRAGVYKSSNVQYNPSTGIALSYGWWEFVKVIKGQRVFNWYPYSNTTIRHQRKVSDLLENLGHHVDVHVWAPDGLQDLASAVQWHESEIRDLEAQIAKPRTHRAKNLERQALIDGHLETIRQLEDLMAPEQSDADRADLAADAKYQDSKDWNK